MEDILARYLDGDLSEEQADLLIRAAEEDPSIAAELREYETILEAAGALPRLHAPTGFADRVMNRIERRRSGAPRRFGMLWPVAASLLVGLAIGSLVPPSRVTPLERARAGSPPAVVFSTVSPAPGQPAVQTIQAIRLVYSATHPGVRRVSVAGTFNGWDPVSAPMSKQGDSWTILLVLPPGTHEYMVIEDGERWITDPAAPRTREDGFGGVNGLLEVRS